jgi:DNA-binding transcriptional MocR family regulator
MPVDDDGPERRRPAGGAGRRGPAAIITPRAQNPTGAVLGASRLGAAQVLAGQPEVLVIEDDHAGPIAGATAHSVTHAHQARWAVVRSVAKMLGPDLRLATVAGDRDGGLRRGATASRHRLGQPPAPAARRRAVAGPRHPDAHRARRGHLHRPPRRAARRPATHGIDAHGASGLNVWVPVPEEDTAIAGLLARGWAVTAGERFRLRTHPALRVTTATLEPADARRLAADLAAAIAPARTGGAWV